MKAQKLIAALAVSLMALAPALSQAQLMTGTGGTVGTGSGGTVGAASGGAAAGGAAGGAAVAGAVVAGGALATVVFAASTKPTSGTQ